MFDKRNSSESIDIITPYISGRPINTSVADADTVELRIEAVPIKIHSVTSAGRNLFRGKIIRIPDLLKHKVEGLSAGQEVEFAEIHIFSYSVRA